MTLQISQRVLDLGEKARQGLAEQFARIDAIAEENTARVLSAFQKHRVAEGYFAGTTGYGYVDLGRDQLTRSTPTCSAPRRPWCASSSSTAPTPSPAPSSGR